MYRLQPAHTYILDTARESLAGAACVERIMEALGIDKNDVTVFGRDQAPDVVREVRARWSQLPETAIPRQHRRPLVFTNIQIDPETRSAVEKTEYPSDVPATEIQRVLGLLPLVRDTHSQGSDDVRNHVCWNTQDFGVMSGCPHGCQYCGEGKHGKMIVVGANIDEYMERVVGPTIDTHPGQKCFRLIGWGSDIATFEPEYGAFEAFLSKLAEYPDHYGYFHTAGDNVDWVEHVAHRDRLIGVWSLTCDAIAERIEPGAPSAEARIEAARRCQQWGLPVRFKFKPMIPVRNWREEYAQAIELIFRHVKPESIGAGVLMWMPLDSLAEKIDLNLLDPEFVDAARSHADLLRDVRTGPFPHGVRAKIYRFLIREIRRWDKHVPVYVSTESREMWDELADEIGQNARTFVCGCNPIQAPGPRMMPSRHLKASTYR